MGAPKNIIQLVETFSSNLDAYKSGAFNETQVRHQFIDPLFEALGWDVNNKQGWSEVFKEVVHEDAIKIGGATKAPDYSFRIGGQRIFFVEAKKPSVNIRDDISPAYQLRRYAWSAKLPLSILTDFEEFAVYDCRTQPAKSDKSSSGRKLYFTFDQYPDAWDDIAEIFSKEAVLKGSFQKFAESHKGRGKSEVDKAFLQEIERWRELLAKNIAKLNPGLSVRDLNFAVQRTIDRIIFLRMCEDRGIETYGQLQALLNGSNVYQRLVGLFHRADERYNSGLFHFQKEKGRDEAPDELTPELSMDDKALKDILRNLYYPESPYEFSVLPADILGNVYEQFLGKVIRLTPSHQAKVEDKPEVRKAGGVYYTPRYIVEYIVKNTVGKLCEGKTPKHVSRLRILDPACGSGSFLIGAYTYLLDWHLNWYVGDGLQKYKKELYQGQGGQWMLTTAEKKRILLNNIYGVDIDSQAVEVTKLNLLLKVLEGESEETLVSQFKLFKERALPDLGGNIKCGNSLIGPDFYEGTQLVMLDDEERYRINAFDWKKEFKEIMAPSSVSGGGFDAVIGNPPYIRIQAMKEWAPVEVEFYKQRYVSASSGNYDIYVVFVEKGLNLLNENGRLGYILPHKFFNSKYGEALRGVIAKGKHLSHVVYFGDKQIFDGATTYTTLLFLDHGGNDSFEFVRVDDLEEWKQGMKQTIGKVKATTVKSSEWNFTVGKGAELFERLSRMPVKLRDIADIFVGLQTSADDVFIMDFIEDKGDRICLWSVSLNQKWTFEKELLFPIVSGADVIRYAELPKRQLILFPYNTSNGVVLIPFNELARRYPLVASYLNENKRRLESRERGKFKGMGWYRFGRNQNIGIQDRTKICVPRLVTQLYASYDAAGRYFLDNVDVGGITLKGEYLQLDHKYLLCLLNSKLLRWYFPKISAPFRGGWFSANKQFLSQLPVPMVDKAINKYQGVMVHLVDHMLLLHKKLATAKSSVEKEHLEKEIANTDAAIDRLVYELYGLTEEEIRIVEEG